LRETAAKATNIIPIKKSGTLPPLFLVHGLGGGIVDYGDLAHQICPDLPVYGIQDLGLDEKEDIHLSIEEMAERYIQAIRSIQPDGPYYLGGYCFGGVVAYEIARQLGTQGIETALLAILEGYAPVVVDSKQQRRLSNLKGFLLNFPYWLRDFVRLERAKKKTRILRLFRSLLQSVVFLVYRPDRIDLRDFVDQDIEQIPEIHRRIMESHLRAQRTYVPQKISGRITLFRVRGLSPFRSYDSTMGWSSLTETGVDVHMIEGAHFNILMKPQVDALAEKLRASLECARSGRR